MNFIKRLFKNLWEYLLLPLILILLVLIILAITIGVISFIAILPSLLLNRFNIQSYFLTIPVMVWFFSVFGTFIFFLVILLRKKKLNGINYCCMVYYVVVHFQYYLYVVFIQYYFYTLS